MITVMGTAIVCLRASEERGRGWDWRGGRIPRKFALAARQPPAVLQRQPSGLGRPRQGWGCLAGAGDRGGRGD